MIRRIPCKVLIVAFSASASIVCPAATVTFPSTGSDIASASDWGLESLPEVSDAVMFKSSKTVTACSDVEFGGLYIGAQGVSVTFDMRDMVSGGSPRKIKMNGKACIYDGSNANANLWNASYILRGGFWNFGEYSVGVNPSGVWSGPAGCSARIDGGAVVTCGQLLGAAIGPNNDRTANIWVSGEGTVVTAGMLKVANDNGFRNTMTVSDGAKVVLTGSIDAIKLDSATQSNTSGGNRLIVTNAASVTAESTNKGFCGARGNGNCILIYSGAHVSISGYLYFGHTDGNLANTSVDNQIVVHGTGSSLSIGTMYHGNAYDVAASAGNSNCVVSVLDGSTVSCGRWNFNGHDNGIVISNATLTLSSGIKCATSQRCSLRFQGVRPSFVSTADVNDYSQLKDGFKLCYDLPADGYDGTVEWPFMVSNRTQLDGSLIVEVSGIEGVLAKMKTDGAHRRTIKLANFSSGFTANAGITDAMLESWNAALPEGAAIMFAENKLTLELKRKRGMDISFR